MESFFGPNVEFQCNGRGKSLESCVCNQDEQQIQCGAPADDYIESRRQKLTTVTPRMPPGVKTCPTTKRKRRSVVSENAYLLALPQAPTQLRF